MQALHHLTSKTTNSRSLRYITSYFFTTHIPKPSPDEPSAAYYDNLVFAAGRKREYAAVRHLLNKRVRDGFFNTTNTFRFISTDLSVLDELLQTLAQLDKGFPRKSAYDALIAFLSKMHRTDDALRVAEAMVRGGYGANACTFHPIINALTRKKKTNEAWRVIDLMRESQISPDLTAYNYLLTAYCFVGDLKPAAALLTRVAEEGLGADARTYDALVLGACRAGKVEGALALLRRMEDDGMPALYCTHAHVIAGLLKLGYYTQAVEFVNSYGGRDKQLDGQNFGLLARRLIGLKRMEEAKLVLMEMSRRGLKMVSQKLKDFYELHIQE